MTKEGDDENTWGDHPKLEINKMPMTILNVHWSTKLEIFINEEHQSK
jgi:hypothetical protein